MTFVVGDFFLIFPLYAKKFEKSQYFQVILEGRSALFDGRSMFIHGRSEGLEASHT